MKILHVSPSFHPCIGGIERYVEELCDNLIRCGHRSDVVCLNTCINSKKPLSPYQNYKGVEVFRIPYLVIGKFKDKRADKRGLYQIALKVFSFLKDYDIIHIHGLSFFSDILSTTKLFHKKPLIISPHGGFFHTERLNFFKRIFFHTWTKFILKMNKKVIVSSINDEKLFSNISKECCYIPYSIYTKQFDIKRKIEEYSFLFIGRFSANKRIDRLIEMIFYLKKRMPKVKLYIIGDGDKEDLLKIIKNKSLEKNVIFTGYISEKEKMEYLSKVQFFVSASEYEAFGLSVVEAMATGVPVIVNDIHSFRNLIENEKTGFIVDFSKPRNVAELVFKLLNDKNKLKHTSNNAKKSAKKYDWSETIKKFEEIYETVIK